MILNLLAAKTMSYPTRVCVDDVTSQPATEAKKMMGVLLGRNGLNLTPPQGIATVSVK